jgi:hypothetical protein
MPCGSPFVVGTNDRRGRIMTRFSAISPVRK